MGWPYKAHGMIGREPCRLLCMAAWCFGVGRPDCSAPCIGSKVPALDPARHEVCVQGASRFGLISGDVCPSTIALWLVSGSRLGP